MAYVKQTFVDGTTKLKASHLNNIEQGIVDNETAISSANAKISQVQSSIPSVPTALKNPYKLTINKEKPGENGTTIETYTYDGSADVDFIIPAYLPNPARLTIWNYSSEDEFEGTYYNGKADVGFVVYNEKYIANAVDWQKMNSKPFGIYGENATYVDLTTITFDGGMAPIMNTIDWHENADYEVTIGSDVFIRKCKYVKVENGKVYYIGNLANSGDEGAEDTGEPFLIMDTAYIDGVDEGVTAMLIYTGSETSVTFKLACRRTVEKLDEEYLPDDLMRRGDASVEEIVQQVIAAIGVPVFGVVDNNKNIVLTGNLADGTYTVKYENADGSLTDIGTIVFGAGESGGNGDTTDYTNQIPISTDTDGSIYNATGYKESARCSSDGSISDIASGTNPAFVTGFIPCKQGDVIRLKNCYIHAHGTNAAYEAIYGNGTYGLRSALYDSSKAKICVFSWGNLSEGGDTEYITYTQNGSDYKLTEFTVALANTAYIRLTLAADNDPKYAIVTVNEEIVGDTLTYTNQIPISTDTDGSVFNTSGWQMQQRLNSSGGLTANGTLTATDGSVTNVTGFIPATTGDIIRTNAGVIAYGATSGYTRICFYDSSKGYVTYQTLTADEDSSKSNFSIAEDGSLYFEITQSGISYIRIAASGINSDAIVTINEEIT